MTEEQLRYPIGKFTPQTTYSDEELAFNISKIQALPDLLEDITKKIPQDKLDTPYRPGGWTARQVIHHLADSHLNAYIRFKWTLTENTPLIKAYDEKLWAVTPETLSPPELSIHLIHALHAKWGSLLSGMDRSDFEKTFIHPETKKEISLARMTSLYAWHGEHHIGHIKLVIAA